MELPEPILPSTKVEYNQLPDGGEVNREFSNISIQVLNEMDETHRKVITFYMRLLSEVVREGRNSCPGSEGQERNFNVRNSSIWKRVSCNADKGSEGFIKLFYYMVENYDDITIAAGYGTELKATPAPAPQPAFTIIIRNSSLVQRGKNYKIRLQKWILCWYLKDLRSFSGNRHTGWDNSHFEGIKM